MADETEDAALPLFPSEGLPALPADEVARRQAIRAGNRGLGRPKGAVNRRTEMWAQHLLGRGASPLLMMQETYLRPVADLARELGCTLLEAFELQLKAAIELAPYLHGKMPVAIDLTTRGLVHLTIEDGQGAAGAEAELFGTIVENQGDGS